MSDTGNVDISFEVKSQLAKLLATENIIIQHDANARTAMFDVKNRILLLPVWKNISNDLYDMLVVHEVGHALDTNSDAWMKALVDIYNEIYDENVKDVKSLVNNPRIDGIKMFFNVIEDARIDKRQKRRYPGSRRNYVIGYKELHERDFFGVKDSDYSKLKLIDRINIYYKGGLAFNIPFSPEERVFLKRIDNAETFDDVVSIVTDLYKHAKMNDNSRAPSTNSDTDDFFVLDDDSDDFDLEGYFDDGDESGSDKYDDYWDDSDDSDDESDGSGSSSEDDSDDDSGKESNDVGDGITPEKKVSQKNSYSNGSGNKEEEEEYIPTSVTERNAMNSATTIVSGGDTEFIYMTLPEPNMDAILDNYNVVLNDMRKNYGSRGRVEDGMKSLRKVLSDEKDAVSYMVKEFEMKKAADAHSRTLVSKTGMLNTNKLHSYKYEDDIFKKLTITPDGKNHGFVMFLDWSGSMNPSLKYTIRQLISLTMFCRRVQIPFEVYLFRDRQYSESHKKSFNYKKGDVVFGELKVRNILSSKMNLSQYNEMLNYLWMAANRNGSYADQMGGTPLNQTIVVADRIIEDFRKKNRVQVMNVVFLTDGASDTPLGIYQNSRFHSTKKREVYILKDNKTNKTYSSVNNISSGYYKPTETFLRVLKDRVDCNLIGFFLYEGALTSGTLSSMFGSQVYSEKNKTMWKDNNYVEVSTFGFDKYYVIRCLKELKNNMNIDKSMTKSKIQKEFSNFSKKKKTNRVLLGKFIDNVCSDKKSKFAT